MAMAASTHTTPAGPQWRRLAPTNTATGRTTVTPRLVPKRGQVFIGILKKAFSAVYFTKQKRPVDSSLFAPRPQLID